MENLKNMFTIRDDEFEKRTLEIFAVIHTSLVCVTEFLDEIDPFFSAGNVTWEDTNLVDDLIVIIGIVEYDPDTTIELEGEVIQVTEDNLEYFQRVVHMSLPFNLVVNGDEEEIMDFLYELHGQENEEDTLPLIDEVPQSNTDFNLTELTDKQQQSLLLYNNNNKTKN